MQRPRKDWLSCFTRILRCVSAFVACSVYVQIFTIGLRLKARQLALEMGAPSADNVKRPKTAAIVPAGQECKGPVSMQLCM